MNDIPVWLKAASVITGMVVGVGAVLWAVFMVWPYMRITRRAMLRSLELGVQSTEILKQVQGEVIPMVADLRRTIDDIKKADVGRAVSVVDALAKSGALDRLAGASERLAAQLHDLAAKTKGKAVDELINKL